MKFKIENNKTIYTQRTGQELARDPLANKGSAFTYEERSAYGLNGFFPSSVLTLQDQLKNVYEEFNRYEKDNLGKYNYLNGLRNRNTTLFYSFIMSHPVETLPIIYTPTVGEACLRYSRIFRFPEGLFINPENIDLFEDMLEHLEYFDPKAANICVVTDGEGILGLGDLGVDGMGIPIGKLSLYIAGSGIYPYRVLPISLDVGTNNHNLLADGSYRGLKQPRLADHEYYEFLDKFVRLFKKILPNSILQFEDFSKQRAITILEKYQDELPCFNDDMQGTGAVVLAGLYNAVKIRKCQLKDISYLFHGYGAAGHGIALQIYSGLLAEGLTEEQAKAKIFICDSRGLVTTSRNFGKEPYKKFFSKEDTIFQNWVLVDPDNISLSDILRNTRAEALLGVSTQKDAFTQEVVSAMMEYSDRPIIFPLSNPTDLSEAHPANLYQWTKGKVITATGSPFNDVVYNGKRYIVGQGNNLFVFPGLGLGLSYVEAKKITPAMLTVAAKTVADLVDAETLSLNGLYPPVTKFREVCLRVAANVAQYAVENNLAKKPAVLDYYQELKKSAWQPLEGYFELKKL